MSQSLPRVTKAHLHENVVRGERSPHPDAGTEDYLKAIALYNNHENYQDCQLLLRSALAKGLRAKFAAVAHWVSGTIFLKTGDILNAAHNFLNALAQPERSASTLWEAATYLASIYRAAGRVEEANSLHRLSERFNSLGVVHKPETERLIIELVQEARLA